MDLRDCVFLVASKKDFKAREGSLVKSQDQAAQKVCRIVGVGFCYLHSHNYISQSALADIAEGAFANDRPQLQPWEGQIFWNGRGSGVYVQAEPCIRLEACKVLSWKLWAFHFIGCRGCLCVRPAKRDSISGMANSSIQDNINVAHQRLLLAFGTLILP